MKENERNKNKKALSMIDQILSHNKTYELGYRKLDNSFIRNRLRWKGNDVYTTIETQSLINTLRVKFEAVVLK